MTISEKRDHEFAGKLGGIYGKVWREEMEARNFIILL